MTRSAEWPEAERLIASALQVNGRAPWGVLARALDIPERTVARRGQRLLDIGAVRVSTYLDTTRVGHARPLVIQVATVAGQALNVARVLAHRDDASSVSVLEGSGDVVCMLLPRSPEASTSLLLHEIPAIEGVISTEVSTVLRYFRSGYDWFSGRLPDDVVAELRSGAPVEAPHPSAPAIELSADDEALVARLADDGRSAVATLARDLNSTAQTIRRRLDALFDAGRTACADGGRSGPAGPAGGTDVVVPRAGCRDRRGRVGLGKHPAVRFCVASTGSSQLMIDCLVEDTGQLYQFLTHDVAAHRSATIARSSVVLMPVRRGPMTVLAESDDRHP
jgi:DNA-binding Lrp family transcriptional regulator